MTITLAAVYAPVGIQGGLTGALFREFAFTLAGAVIVSGVVALTLSPMMGAKLLRAGDTERGFAGWINRRFESVRNAYTRTLAGRSATGRSCSTLWAIVAAADRAVLHVLAAGAGADRGPGRSSSASFRRRRTRRSIRRSCSRQQIYDVYRSLPESDSIFQITFPTGGFGGMTTKPWSERTKTTEQLVMETMGPLSQIPGIRVIPVDAAAAAGRRRLPGRLRHRIGGRAAATAARSPTSSCRRPLPAGCSSSPTPT